jgi:hypothetical protein
MDAQGKRRRDWWRILRRESIRGQLLVTVVVALLLGGATYSANQAADSWQKSTTEEIKWSARALEQLRFVYLDEASDAALIARWENRAAVLGDLAATGAAGLLSAEAETARKIAEQKVFGLSGTNSLVAEKFRLPGGGFDVVRRLAELRQQETGVAAASAPTLMDDGDRLSLVAAVLTSSAVLSVLGWLLFQGVVYARKSGRRVAAEPSAPDNAGLVPHPWTAPQRSRRLTAIALAGWTLVTLIPAGGLYVSAAGQRSGADAARMAVTISTYIQASNLYSSQALLQHRIAIDQAQAGLSRKLAAINLSDAAQDELGTAEVQAADAWSVIGKEMMRLPTTGDGIDTGLVLAMSATSETWADALKVQAAASQVSEDANRATNLFTLAATLAALAMSLVTLALARPGWPVAVPFAGMALLAAAVVTAVAGVLAFF